MGYTWLDTITGDTVILGVDQGRIKVRCSSQQFYIIKNYNNEPVDFVGNWGVTHFEQLVFTRDGSNIRIRLPNYKYLIFENTAPCAFSYKNFHLPVGFSGYSVIPRKHYTGTEEDDFYQGLTLLGSTLKGLGGNDRLLGGEASDTIDGGHGDDTIYGRGGGDALIGHLGNDVIFGGADSDEIQGGDGEDKLYGEEGNDVINGGSGNDIINGGSGENTLTGGLGADIFEIPYEKGTHIIEDFDLTQDRLHLIGNFPSLFFEILDLRQEGYHTHIHLSENLRIVLQHITKTDLTAQHFRVNDRPILQTHYIGTASDDIYNGYMGLNHTIYGRAGNDRLTGEEGVDAIYGEEGDDYILAKSGDDFVDGGEGDDRIEGGRGDDRLLGGYGADLISGDAGADSLFGGHGDDFLQGGEDDDTIYGEWGDDHIRGGKGNNTLAGGTGIDHFIIDSRLGEQDIITDYDPAREKIYFNNTSIRSFSQLTTEQRGSDAYLKLPNHQILILKNTYLSDLRSDLLIFDPKHMPQKVWKGTDEEDVIFGHKILNNLISGFGGPDSIWGGDHDDSIEGGDGDDSIEAGSGDDLVYGGDGNDDLDGGVGNDALHAGDGYNRLNGGEGNDSLYSGKGRNALFGGAGDDTLHILGAGWFSGGAGTDLFKIYIPAHLNPPPSRSYNPCPGDNTIKPYQSAIITDFDHAADEKIDLSPFSWVQSFEDLTIRDIEVSQNNREPPLCFPINGDPIHIDDYQKLEPTPLVIISIKEQRPRELVALYNVRKEDLSEAHFIFRNSSSDSLLPIEVPRPEIIDEQQAVQEIVSPEDANPSASSGDFVF